MIDLEAKRQSASIIRLHPDDNVVIARIDIGVNCWGSVITTRRVEMPAPDPDASNNVAVESTTRRRPLSPSRDGAGPSKAETL